MQDLNIMVVGGGGREHALCWKIQKSALVKNLFCAPGNGGTALSAGVQNLPISVDDFEGIANACSEKQIDLVVIGPDNPLADGIVDYLEERNFKVFGPRKAGARLESSKSYAKEVMKDLNIPSARYGGVFENKEDALLFARQNSWAKVVKADGLAFGKGVFVCSKFSEVEEALEECFEKDCFGESGNKVIIEERLDGEELSIFLLVDGKQLVVLSPSQDHKRRYEGDKGPNTGGMGAYSPVPLYDKYREAIEKQVITPLERALKEGRLEYKGVLFIGILIENDVPYVLEFNARFGDPEAQALLPRLKSDLVPALLACTNQELDKIELEWDERYSMCVVAAGDQYPAQSSKNKKIEIGNISEDAVLFHAGTITDKDDLLTNGGRVLSVTGLGNNLEEAAKAAYANIEKVKFEGMDYRKDIGWRVISKCQSK